MPAAARSRFALIWLALGLPAGARAIHGDHTSRDVGDWVVAASSDGQGCFATREYDGPGGTRLLLGLDVDGANRLTVLNDHWSIKPKDRLQLTFRLSTASFPAHPAIGFTDGGKRGFVAGFGREFPTSFARSPTLWIFRSDVPAARLDLRGSSAAVAQLHVCVDAQRLLPTAPGSRREARGAIPVDPFAPASTAAAKR